MTDKEKFHKEVEKLKSNLIYGACSSQIAMETMCKEEAYNEVLAILDTMQEEPVSEDLEKAAEQDVCEVVNTCSAIGIPNDHIPSWVQDAMINEFIHGAQWKEKQLEKNRLAHCDAQTEEEAEIERDFCMGIIENEHRQPTFDDAIKYGMRLQKEQMMKDAVEAVISQVPGFNEIVFYNPASVYKYCLPQEMNKLGLNKGDKVKLIIVKED